MSYNEVDSPIWYSLFFSSFRESSMFLFLGNLVLFSVSISYKLTLTIDLYKVQFGALKGGILRVWYIYTYFISSFVESSIFKFLGTLILVSVSISYKLMLTMDVFKVHFCALKYEILRVWYFNFISCFGESSLFKFLGTLILFSVSIS